MKYNEEGVTLVELLAVLAILSIILGLIGSALMFGYRQFNEQSTTVNHQSDVRYVMSQLSTDVRRLSVNDTVSIDEESNQMNLGGHVYELQGTSFLRDGQSLSQNIASVVWTFNDEENKLDVKIRSVGGARGKQVELASTLYLRR